MIRSSDMVWKTSGRQFVLESSIESTVSSQKGYGLKSTALICATHRMIQADLNFKQQFDSRSLRLDV